MGLLRIGSKVPGARGLPGSEGAGPREPYEEGAVSCAPFLCSNRPSVPQSECLDGIRELLPQWILRAGGPCGDWLCRGREREEKGSQGTEPLLQAGLWLAVVSENLEYSYALVLLPRKWS